MNLYNAVEELLNEESNPMPAQLFYALKEEKNALSRHLGQSRRFIEKGDLSNLTEYLDNSAHLKQLSKSYKQEILKQQNRIEIDIGFANLRVKKEYLGKLKNPERYIKKMLVNSLKRNEKDINSEAAQKGFNGAVRRMTTVITNGYESENEIDLLISRLPDYKNIIEKQINDNIKEVQRRDKYVQSEDFENEELVDEDGEYIGEFQEEFSDINEDEKFEDEDTELDNKKTDSGSGSLLYTYNGATISIMAI